MKGIIYKWTCLINNKSYIGSTIHPNGRKLAHLRNAKKDNFKSPFYKDLKKYSESNFIYEIIEECDEAELSIHETYWINFYDSVNNGYNIKCGGIGRTKQSSDAKKHISEGQKQYWDSLTSSERIERINLMPKVHLSGDKNGMYGYQWTDDQRHQISETKKNNYVKRIWVNKDNNEKLIKEEEKLKYIEMGFILGRCK